MSILITQILKQENKPISPGKLVNKLISLGYSKKDSRFEIRAGLDHGDIFLTRKLKIWIERGF